jgi:crossover junction endodeoxyribonuclease RuvC
VFVLGIDPGLSRCGYGVVRRYGSDLAATAGGVVTTETTLPVQERLRVLFGELRAVVADVRPDAVVVERTFFQTNARTAMATGQAGGVALLAAAESGCPVAQYSANEVKLAVVGFGAATKDQVQRMVAALLGLTQPPRPADVADALALAVCHLASRPLQRAVQAATAGAER